MSDQFLEVLRNASQQQTGNEFILLYYIINPKIYQGEPVTTQTTIATFYPVGTYKTYSDAFKVLSEIVRKIEHGRFRIMKVGKSSAVNNAPNNSVLNTLWDKYPAERLEEIYHADIAQPVKQAVNYDIDNIDSIEYLRDNFSNLCFNHYALSRCDEQHQQILDAIEMRKTNCWKYLAIHGNDDFDQLTKIYEERLPSVGEGHLVGFFTQKIAEKVDGIPKILHKDEIN